MYLVPKSVNDSIVERQQALLRQLQAEASHQAQANALILQSRDAAPYVVMPLTQTTYKWVGDRLVKVTPSSIDGLVDALKTAWAATWGKLLSPTKPKTGVGQHPTVLDPWGKPTMNMPISVRKEIEWEEELQRIHREEAPFAREFESLSGLHGPTYAVTVYRVDNFTTGRPMYPTYAVPFVDHFGMIYLAIGKKHPHLAIEEFKRLLNEGRVAKTVSDFDEGVMGYDSKMFLYNAKVET